MCPIKSTRVHTIWLILLSSLVANSSAFTHSLLFNHIDNNIGKYIQRLSKAVAIQSISEWPDKREQIFKMVNWTKKELEKLGVACELEQLNLQELPAGKVIALPPVLLGTFGNDTKKKTLLVYGHLDVQPAIKEDGWYFEPFVLTDFYGKLYGRGTCDNKGPVIAWINCLEALKELKMEVPVNLKFIFEGMGESGSEGLDEVIFSKKDTFLKDVDFVAISDGNWLGRTKPSIAFGFRGLCYFFVDIRCTGYDLDSTVVGGSVYDAMSDIIHIMNSLVDVNGTILIPGINESVANVSKEDIASYDHIDFEINEIKMGFDAVTPIQTEAKNILMARWSYPSLSLHGIEGGYSGAGAKTEIPRKVTGKFSINLVPNMQPEVIERLVRNHVEDVLKERGSPNIVKVTMVHGSKPWVTDFNNPNYVAGRNAVKRVFGVEPDLTRGGRSLPVTLTLQKATGKSVILLPFGASDARFHSQDENIGKLNYIKGIKLFGAYMDEIAKTHHNKQIQTNNSKSDN